MAPPTPARVYGAPRREQRAAATARTSRTHVLNKGEDEESEGIRVLGRAKEHGIGG